jgi:uncharacterized protein YcbK (DUF882 family)
MPFKALAKKLLQHPAGIHRRQFLKLSLAAASAAAFAPQAAARAARPESRRLAFYNTHTGESLEACYFDGGCHDPAALAAIDRILRDHRTGDTRPIATGLLDLLHTLCGRLETSQPLHVISGYRSPATNAALHAKSRGVASQSLHMCGQAIDIRIPGIATARLREAAVRLAGGGVGYYPGPDFVHIDIGRVRSWG